jgi:hypothetical protein
MANNLSARQQLIIIWNLIKTRPARALSFLMVVIFAIVVAQKYDPIVIKYRAAFGDPTHEIETLILVNPNTDKRDIVLNLSPNGEVNDLGVDEAHVVDLSAKSFRSAKLSLLERSVSIVNILRVQLDHSSIRIPGPIEIETSNSIMRRLAFAYVVSLILFFTGMLQAIASVAGFLLLFKPRELIRSIPKIFK